MKPWPTRSCAPRLSSARPSAVHLYDWHKIPFDNDYPHYFPVKDELADALKTLRAAGIKIMPYINGRLWDTKDRQNEDWQFSKIAYPNCTKDRHGKPFIETYSSKEIDGTKVELSIMCPSTAVWQEKQKEIVGKLFNELDMDAVYIDQIGAAKANPCADKNHPHPAGGGTWWVARLQQPARPCAPHERPRGPDDRMHLRPVHEAHRRLSVVAVGSATDRSPRSRPFTTSTSSPSASTMCR